MSWPGTADVLVEKRRRPSTPGYAMVEGERGDDEHTRPVGGCRVAGDRACRLDPVGAGQRSAADDLLRGSDPEFFEQVCLAPRPGHELVEVPGVQPPVRVRQRSQGTPAGRLAFHAQPEQSRWS
jgi:hypothetical protein